MQVMTEENRSYEEPKVSRSTVSEQITSEKSIQEEKLINVFFSIV